MTTKLKGEKKSIINEINPSKKKGNWVRRSQSLFLSSLKMSKTI